MDPSDNFLLGLRALRPPYTWQDDSGVGTATTSFKQFQSRARRGDDSHSRPGSSDSQSSTTQTNSNYSSSLTGTPRSLASSSGVTGKGKRRVRQRSKSLDSLTPSTPRSLASSIHSYYSPAPAIPFFPSWSGNNGSSWNSPPSSLNAPRRAFLSEAAQRGLDFSPSRWAASGSTVVVDPSSGKVFGLRAPSFIDVFAPKMGDTSVEERVDRVLRQLQESEQQLQWDSEQAQAEMRMQEGKEEVDMDEPEYSQHPQLAGLLGYVQDGLFNAGFCSLSAEGLETIVEMEERSDCSSLCNVRRRRAVSEQLPLGASRATEEDYEEVAQEDARSSESASASPCISVPAEGQSEGVESARSRPDSPSRQAHQPEEPAAQDETDLQTPKADHGSFAIPAHSSSQLLGSPIFISAAKAADITKPSASSGQWHSRSCAPRSVASNRRARNRDPRVCLSGSSPSAAATSPESGSSAPSQRDRDSPSSAGSSSAVGSIYSLSSPDALPCAPPPLHSRRRPAAVLTKSSTVKSRGKERGAGTDYSKARVDSVLLHDDSLDVPRRRFVRWDKGGATQTSTGGDFSDASSALAPPGMPRSASHSTSLFADVSDATSSPNSYSRRTARALAAAVEENNTLVGNYDRRREERQDILRVVPIPRRQASLAGLSSKYSDAASSTSGLAFAHAGQRESLASSVNVPVCFSKLSDPKARSVLRTSEGAHYATSNGSDSARAPSSQPLAFDLMKAIASELLEMPRPAQEDVPVSASSTRSALHLPIPALPSLRTTRSLLNLFRISAQDSVHADEAPTLPISISEPELLTTTASLDSMRLHRFSQIGSTSHLGSPSFASDASLDSASDTSDDSSSQATPKSSFAPRFGSTVELNHAFWHEEIPTVGESIHTAHKRSETVAVPVEKAARIPAAIKPAPCLLQRQLAAPPRLSSKPALQPSGDISTVPFPARPSFSTEASSCPATPTDSPLTLSASVICDLEDGSLARPTSAVLHTPEGNPSKETSRISAGNLEWVLPFLTETTEALSPDCGEEELGSLDGLGVVTPRSVTRRLRCSSKELRLAAMLPSPASTVHANGSKRSVSSHDSGNRCSRRLGAVYAEAPVAGNGLLDASHPWLTWASREESMT